MSIYKGNALHEQRISPLNLPVVTPHKATLSEAMDMTNDEIARAVLPALPVFPVRVRDVPLGTRDAGSVSQSAGAPASPALKRREDAEILHQVERAVWDARWLCDHEGFGNLEPHMRAVTAELLLRLAGELSR